MKKLVVLLLTAAMLLSLVACAAPAAAPAPAAEPAAPAAAPAAPAAEPAAPAAEPAAAPAEEGKVFNLYVWNTEFQEFAEIYYLGTRPINHAAISAAETAGTAAPEPVFYDAAPGAPEGVTVNFILNPSDGRRLSEQAR